MKVIKKIRVGINDIEDRKTIEKINRVKTQLHEEINKVDKLVDKLTK